MLPLPAPGAHVCVTRLSLSEDLINLSEGSASCYGDTRQVPAPQIDRPTAPRAVLTRRPSVHDHTAVLPQVPLCDEAGVQDADWGADHRRGPGQGPSPAQGRLQRAALQPRGRRPLHHRPALQAAHLHRLPLSGEPAPPPAMFITLCCINSTMATATKAEYGVLCPANCLS